MRLLTWMRGMAALTLLASCSLPPASVGEDAGDDAAQKAASAAVLHWQASADCRTNPATPASSPASLAAACQHDPSRGGTDFVALVLSGGGVKASTFGGEAMFMLDRFGLLAEVDMIASASGGSLPAAYYALSCDRWDRACQAQTPRRPLWDYATGMQVMSAGFRPLVVESLALLPIPLVPHTLSPNQFADHLEREAFGGDPARPFRLGDLNPRRPEIYLTAALVGQNRFLSELRRGGPGAGYLRRRNSDQYFHFAFAQPYLSQLRLDRDSLPLSFAVAASGAIPLLFDYARLNDHGSNQPLLLTDGGNNDNQGMMEVYFNLLEVLAGQKRSPSQPERMGPRDRALIFVVNSSLTETTGVNLSSRSDPSRGSSIGNLVSRVSTATDIYSGDGYSLREQLYRRELEALRLRLATDPATRDRWPHWHPDSGTVSPVLAVEIGLTTLDEFPAGGRDAAQRVASALAVQQKRMAQAAEARAPTGAAAWNGVYDPEAGELAGRQVTHREAFQRLRDPATRRRLGLSALHPQCLLEKSKELESSIFALAHMNANAIACLREAARWATALRVQELCVLREQEANLSPEKRQEIGSAVLNQPGTRASAASLATICATEGLRLLDGQEAAPLLDQDGKPLQCQLDMASLTAPSSSQDTPLARFVAENETRREGLLRIGNDAAGLLPDRACEVQDQAWQPSPTPAPAPAPARRPVASRQR